MENNENEDDIKKSTEEINEENNQVNIELEQKELENDNEENFESNVEEAKSEEISNKKVKIAMIIIIAIVISISLVFAGIVVINKLNDKVYKNVFLFGQDMSGKTTEQVIEFLNSKLTETNKNIKLNIYQNDESIFSIESESIDFSIDVEATAKKVIDFGRSKNIFKDNFQIIKALFSKLQIEPSYIYDTAKLDDILKQIDLTVEDRYTDDSFDLDEEHHRLIIKKGKSGNSINYENEKNKIVSALSKGEDDKIDLDIIIKSPNNLELKEVYNKVKREAKDAYIDETVTPFKFVNEVVGYDFKIEELETLLTKEENQQEGKEIEFPLSVTEPKVKLADITYKLYKDKLAGYTTYFSPSLWGRSRNLEIVLSYMNGKIVMPGETFSYVATVGDITAAKGYQMASTFIGGKEVMDIGGGVCQTVSTLYNTALLANMEIVERHQHSLPVGYVKPSLDATTYVPVLDLKFKNTRKYPIKIVTSFSWSGNLNVSIYGTKEEVEYDISLSSNYIRTIPFTTKYINDTNLEEGKQVIDTKGVNGYVSESYITKSLNGSVVSKNLLSRDTYKAQQQVVRIGKKQ